MQHSLRHRKKPWDSVIACGMAVFTSGWMICWMTFLGTPSISGTCFYFVFGFVFFHSLLFSLCILILCVYSVFYFRYRVSQRVGAQLPTPMLPGLPPYCLMLRRVEDAQILSTDSPSITGVRVTAAELPHVHRGSRVLMPFDAVGEFSHLTAGLPPTTIPGGTHHRFNLHWEYQDEGNWAIFSLIVLGALFFGF